MKPSRVIVASLLLAIAIPTTILAILELSGFPIAPGSQWLNLTTFLLIAISSLIISIVLLVSKPKPSV